MWLIVLHFAVHWSGSDYGAGYGQFQPYDLYSGLLGLGVLVAAWRHLNCHDPDDWWRIGRYKVADGQFRVCRRHHPDPSIRSGGVTRAHILAAHERHIHPLHIVHHEEGPVR